MSDGVSSTWIYYVDESYDSSKFCLTALGLKAGTWRAAFDAVKQYRSALKDSDGVFLRTEIHARHFTKGHGRVGSKIVSKWRRSRIFYELLEVTAALPDAHMFNVCLDCAGRSDPQLDAWDRLLNRLNQMAEKRNRQENARRRTLLGDIQSTTKSTTYAELERRLIPYAANVLIMADQGHEKEIARLRRKLSVFNMIPSKYGSWGTAPTKNIPLSNLVEDALFRNSAHSYFIQLADCLAFALLKRETPLTPHVRKYGLHKAFDAHLPGICVRQASSTDPLGVVRN